MNPDLVKGPWTKEEDQKVSWGRRQSEHWTVTVCRGDGGVRPLGSPFQWWIPVKAAVTCSERANAAMVMMSRSRSRPL